VHILILEARCESALSRFSPYPLQPPAELIRLSVTDHPALGEHAGMRDGSIEILLQEVDVEADGGIETLDRRMQPLLETVTPGCGASSCHSASHRLTSTQISSACQAGERGTEGSITSSRTFSTTIEASSSN